MTFRRISIPISVIALLVVRALSAFQTPDATKQAQDVTKAVTRKAKKAGASETAAARQAASSAASTAERTTGRADRMASTATGTAAPTPANAVSDSEIAAAKASGKVWVNTDSGTYHKGGRWYGATKQGRFMTEQDAIGAGYHAARSKTH